MKWNLLFQFKGNIIFAFFFFLRLLSLAFYLHFTAKIFSTGILFFFFFSSDYKYFKQQRRIAALYNLWYRALLILFCVLIWPHDILEEENGIGEKMKLWQAFYEFNFCIIYIVSVRLWVCLFSFILQNIWVLDKSFDGLVGLVITKFYEAIPAVVKIKMVLCFAAFFMRWLN